MKTYLSSYILVGMGEKGALENFGSTGRHVHERQQGEATLKSTREFSPV
jgi:hypothetical protein